MQINSVKLQLEGGYMVNGTLYVPSDPLNRDFRAVQAWIAAGNTPEAADPIPAPEPSEIDVLKRALADKAIVSAADLNKARGDLRSKR